jgi:hypothetical protein
VDTRTTAAELRTRLSDIADALYRLESDGELALLRDPSVLRGRSATVAAEVATRTARLWERYPAVKDVVDRLDSGDRSDPGEAADGIAVLEADLAAVEREAHVLTAAWAALVPQLDDLTARVAAVAAQAAEVAADDEPEVAMAEAAVEGLGNDVAADPLGADPAPARLAVEQAEALVDGLVRQRDGLSAALARSQALVDELAAVMEHGSAALDRSRIAEPEGLLAPLDPAVLDVGPQGLRPWLARIRAEADEGNWRTAATALDRWSAVAEGWLANARRVADANSAPVRRRDELRGLLDAYKAKAGRAGLAEDVALGRLHQAAHEALHTAPCRLDEAEALVRSYVDAVNGAP